MVNPPPRKDIEPLPNHIAIIMDGNGRWAKQRKLPRMGGHKAGIEAVRTTVQCLSQYQIKCVTLYSFSTENWKRPPDEIEGLFQLFEERINKETIELHNQGIRILHLGQLDRLSPSLQEAMKRAAELTKNNPGMTLAFAINYGGRTEILDAVHRLISEGVPYQKIDEKLFGNYLYTAGLPDVDLVIRTGGELRLSNFLIWQAAYAEYYFTEVLWPDINQEEIEKALLSFSQRQRRFGGL